jgi:hypothetical protein
MEDVGLYIMSLMMPARSARERILLCPTMLAKRAAVKSREAQALKPQVLQSLAHACKKGIIVVRTLLAGSSLALLVV